MEQFFHVENVVLLNPANKPLATDNRRVFPVQAIFLLVVPLLGLPLVLWTVFRSLPQQYEQMREYEQFVAQSQITEAEVTACYNSLIPGNKQIMYSFSLDGQVIKGVARYDTTCEQYPAGTPIMVRYLPSDPSETEGLHEDNLVSSNFYLFVLNSILITINSVILGWQGIQAMWLHFKGQVRTARVLSITPILFLWAWLRYEIPADNGSVIKGQRLVMRHQIRSAAQGSPLAVLFASKRNYVVL